MSKKVYWTDFHSNPHHGHVENFMEEWYDQAREMLDFWGVAYYPFKAYEGSKEDITDHKVVVEGIEKVNELAAEKFERDGYIIFPGYEWQGNGEDGDHNVFFRKRAEFHNPMTYLELIGKLPLNESMAISHHPAYAVGHRGKNWDTHDHRYSPVTEIYSSHGCSEDDVCATPIDVHIHMGPKEGRGTVYQGLNSGKISGIICSGDNHCTPAISGNGFMGVISEEYTREALFNAILNRNTYGVTRSKIDLGFDVDGETMGAIIPTSQGEKHRGEIQVRGTSAIDRVEIIKNGVAEYTYVHNGTWEKDTLEGNVKFKFELEFGWGPDLRVYPDLNKKVWDVKVETAGRICDVEKLWKHPGQEIKRVTDDTLEMSITTRKEKQGNAKLSQKNYLSPYISNQSVIIEMEAPLDSEVVFTVDGKLYRYSVRELLEGSKLEADVDEIKEIAKERFGFEEFYRSDPYWHNAYKFKIHKAFPERAYSVSLDYELEAERDLDYTLVKVYQKNGDMAWSSPVWLKK